MVKIVLDSATKFFYVAIVKGEEVLVEKCVLGMKNHAEHSVVLLQDSMKEAGVCFDDVSEVIVGIGPGSYTGVRIAVTMAKMIGAFTNVKVGCVSTLYLMSSFYEGNIVSFIDARRGNSFSCVYENDIEIQEEKLRENFYLEQTFSKEKYQFISEDLFKVNPVKVCNKAVFDIDVHNIVPNYLRMTEAEFNLKNDKTSN